MAILSSHLTKHNYEVLFLAKRVDKKDNYIKEYQIRNDLILTYTGFREYMKKINYIRPDLVVSWDPMSSLYNLLLFRITGFIFINASIRHGIRLNRLSHYFRSLVCHFSPYLLANSEAGLKANRLRKKKGQRLVLYNGVETKFLGKLTIKEIEALRMRLIPGYRTNPGFVYISVANFVSI